MISQCSFDISMIYIKHENMFFELLPIVVYTVLTSDYTVLNTFPNNSKMISVCVCVCVSFWSFVAYSVRTLPFVRMLVPMLY